MQLTSLTLGAWTATADENEIRLDLGGAAMVIPKEQVNDLIALLMMTSPADAPEFVNIQEASDRLGKVRASLRRVVDTDRVPGMIKVGDVTGIMAAALPHIEFGKPGNPAWLKPESED